MSKQTQAPASGEEVAVIKTSKGDIFVRLFPEHAPKAVENFKTHAKNGYYHNFAKLFCAICRKFLLALSFT